jgi:hypothetical protein
MTGSSHDSRRDMVIVDTFLRAYPLSLNARCAILSRHGIMCLILCVNHKESDVKEPQFFLRREKCDLWLTPLAVQFSDFGWTAAPHLPQSPDPAIPLGRTDAAQPAFPPRDDVVGWPDELLIDFPDFPDCTLDAIAAFRTRLRLLIDGDVGVEVGVFPEDEEICLGD